MTSLGEHPPVSGVAAGQQLAPLNVAVDRTMIVATAIAGRDYQDVHHDPDLARERGSSDIFMNILTTNGLIDRFVTSWAGPDAVLKGIRIRLGVPTYPGDTLVLSGEVSAVDGDRVDVAVRGENDRGVHVSGTVSVAMGERGRA